MHESAADNLTLLGQPTAKVPDAPSPEILESFPNPKPGRHYVITLDCPEFSSLCPVTGQPDSADIEIRYVPGGRCIETKSLKFYLASYRNQPGFNEAIANSILDDLVSVCEPHQMLVRAQFATRGGIQLTVEASHPDPDSP
jgi:7-cyano-7-deazaguanine reductase